MALEVSRVGEVVVVSVHDEEEPIHFSVPSVVPSRYDIPGISAPREVFSQCRMSIQPGQKPMQYALHRTLNHHPYVLIRIVEPNTFIYGTEEQKIDEYGQRLAPDVMRVPVPVRVEAIANEIERIYGQMGLKAVRGEVTAEIINECEKRNNEFLRKRVQQTTVWAQKDPNNVTPQARRSAWILHRKGLLSPLPTWATIDPDSEGQTKSTFNCKNCGALLMKDAAKCAACGAIYNRKLAYELGFLKDGDLRPGEDFRSPIIVDVEVEDDPMTPLTGQMTDADTGKANTSAADLHAAKKRMIEEQEEAIVEAEEAPEEDVTDTVTEE